MSLSSAWHRPKKSISADPKHVPIGDFKYAFTGCKTGQRSSGLTPIAWINSRRVGSSGVKQAEQNYFGDRRPLRPLHLLILGGQLSAPGPPCPRYSLPESLAPRRLSGLQAKRHLFRLAKSPSAEHSRPCPSDRRGFRPTSGHPMVPIWLDSPSFCELGTFEEVKGETEKKKCGGDSDCY